MRSSKRCVLRFSRVMRHLCALLVMVASAASTHAAEFRFERDKRGQMLLYLEGPIESGDFLKFELSLRLALARPFTNQLVLVLDSPGGDVAESIRIGRLTRELLLTTRTSATTFRGLFDAAIPDTGEPWGGMRVADGTLRRDHPKAGQCWSACTIIFASGVIRQAVDNTDKKDERLRVPTIGVHRPKMRDEYYSGLTPGQAREAHKAMLTIMGDFLLEMGASQSFVARTMETRSHEIDLIEIDELAELLPKVEPFFEDWIAAKCGRKTDILSASDRYAYQLAPGEITYADWGFGYGETDSLGIDYRAINDDILIERVALANYKVMDYSDFIQFCRIVTVKTHQTEWLNRRHVD